MIELPSPLPRSKSGFVCWFVLAALVGVRLLGEQGARLGPLSFPSIGAPWLLGACVLVFFIVPGSSRRPHVPAFLAFAIGLALLYGPLASWRAGVVEATPSLELAASRLSTGRPLRTRQPLGTLSIESRQDLNRLVGRRHDVRIELAGSLVIPEPGRYLFELDCDDRCGLRIGGRRLARGSGSARVEASLEEGTQPFSIVFEQRQGPAYLLIRWRRPAWIELLPMDHFVAGSATAATLEDARDRERGAAVSFLSSVAWWLVVLAMVVGAGEARAAWRERLTTGRGGQWAPVGAAALLVLVGTLFRVDALLVRSHLVDTSPVAAAAHERMRPLLPDYRAFYRPNFRDNPYRADVRSYLDRAATMRPGTFYAASFREPFYVVLVKFFVWLSGGREIGALLQSLFFSIAVLPLIFVLATRWFGRWWAVAALLPIVLHEWLVFEAPSGYRESAYSFFLLCFAASVFLPSTKPRMTRAVLWGVLGAMICLIRITGASFVVPLLILAGWTSRKEGGWKACGVALLTIVVLVGPYLLSCTLAHGDPFYAISFHTQFWLRAENPDRSADQVSVFRYLLEFHGMGELLAGELRGLTILPVRSFWNGLRHFPLLGWLVLAGGLVGLIFSLPTRFQFLLVAYWGHLIPFAYIQNFPSGRAPRFVMPAFFFLVLAAVWLARRLWR
ncbi:MAG: hypothetical protein ACRD1X_08080, partial [Vicinamibacteria bacterium]